MKSNKLMLVGFALGAFHGIILHLSYISFNTASFILYGNRYFLPIWSTIVIDTVTLVAVLTSGIWLPFMMNLQEKYAVRRE